jgi:hypothetical protein
MFLPLSNSHERLHLDWFFKLVLKAAISSRCLPRNRMFVLVTRVQWQYYSAQFNIERFFECSGSLLKTARRISSKTAAMQIEADTSSVTD